MALRVAASYQSHLGRTRENWRTNPYVRRVVHRVMVMLCQGSSKASQKTIDWKIRDNCRPLSSTRRRRSSRSKEYLNRTSLRIAFHPTFSIRKRYNGLIFQALVFPNSHHQDVVKKWAVVVSSLIQQGRTVLGIWDDKNRMTVFFEHLTVC